MIRVLFLLTAFSLATSTQGQKKAYISRTPVPPVIDGIRDTLWNRTNALPVLNLYSGTIDSPADFSASWSALWDTVNIYFLAEVNDDLLRNSGPGAVKFWIHDCLEIFFDMLNEKNGVETGDSPTDDKYQYRFIYGLDSEPIAEQPPVSGMVNVSRAAPGGYLIEVSLPWTTLKGTHPVGDIIHGRSIGAEIQVADLDNSPMTWMPDANLVWNNPNATMGLKMASNFGTIILCEDNLPDTLPPGPVNDLTLTSALAMEAVVAWTSPGDDGLRGLAEVYSIRLSSEMIDETNWDAALPAQNPPCPLIAGSLQTTKLTGLKGNTDYFIAIRTGDEAGNWSEISNVIRVATPPPDTIPPAPVSDLMIKRERTNSIEIGWTAPGDDGNIGRATYFEVRYHTSEINTASWELATLAENVPLPDTAGGWHTMNISGLLPGQRYFFSIRSTDEQQNCSVLSNCATGTTPQIQYSDQTPMDQFIGTNAFIDDPLDKLKVAGFLREYHPWEWDAGSVAYPNNRAAWNPSYAGGGWNFDSYYKKLLDNGITVSPCILGSTPWLSPAGSSFPYENKPVGAGQDPLDPASYKAHADHLFQYAARYGSRQVPDSLLKIAGNQPRVSGLGYLRYLENWNEPDRWWGDASARFSAEEYAAMGSADRDGHEGTLGATCGMKNADPAMKLVMAGLASSEISYIEAIRQWCLQHRTDRQFVYDVINIHHYTGGSSPEAGDLQGFVKNIREYRDTYLPDVEVWITEFGWDTGSNITSFSCPMISSYSREEVQAQWIARSYLLLSASGIDRAAQFMLRNVRNNGTIDFETCGLVNQKNDWTPKPSWYYTYTMRNVLKNKVFSGQVASGNPDVRIQRYENQSRDTIVYAVWATTSNGKRINSFSLQLPDTMNTAWKVTLTPGFTEGISSSLPVVNHAVNFAVSEKTVFIGCTLNTSTVTRWPEPVHQHLHAYPNPVQDVTTIVFQSPIPVKEIKFKIFNVSGLCISEKKFSGSSEQTTWQEDFSGLPKGVYYLEVRSAAGRSVMQLVKTN